MADRTTLDAATIASLADDLPGWTVEDGKRLVATWRFPDFDAAFAFVTEVAAFARDRDHHPDIAVGWGYATVTLTTHDAGGLTRADVLLASDIAGIAPV